VPPGQLNGTATGTAETFQYFYHPDHLGSTSYITDASGEVYQHLEYIAFGETFVEEHSNTDRTPYLFNGKELDEETGLYYYGARYYDPRTSVWQSVDPLADQMQRHSPYNYGFNNPIRFIDLDGLWPQSTPPGGTGISLVQAFPTVLRWGQNLVNATKNAANSYVKNAEKADKFFERNSKVKDPDSPGPAFEMKGNKGDDSKLGGKKDGNIEDLTYLPTGTPPSPLSPLKPGAGVIENGLEALGSFQYGNDLLGKLDKATDGGAEKAANATINRPSKPSSETLTEKSIEMETYYDIVRQNDGSYKRTITQRPIK
jgi:RHS repeat-associated protein